MAVSDLTDASLDDIQRDAEHTEKSVGAPGCVIRVRARATVRLVEEARRLRTIEAAARAYLAALEARSALVKLRPDFRIDESGTAESVRAAFAALDAQYAAENELRVILSGPSAR